MKQIALQLYSLRKWIPENVPETLRKVREIGFRSVELAGLYGYSAAEMKQMLDAADLTAISAHISLEEITDYPEQVLQTAQTLGLANIVCPFAKLTSQEEIEQVAQALNHMQALAAEENIAVGYHNHDKEFLRLDGDYVLDLLLDLFEHPQMFAEIDTCWLAYAGADPVSYIRHLGAKAGPIHIKELNRNFVAGKPETVDACIGEGSIDFPAILEILAKAGTLDRGVIVEQEGFTEEPFEQLAKNVRYLESIWPEA